MTAGKQIASATAWLTLSNAAVRLISLVTMPVLTRLLPAQAYGGASLAGTMISLLSVLFMAGIDMSYARSYFATTGPGGKEVEAFVWRYAVLAALASGVVGGLIWFVVAPFFQLDRSLAGIVGAGAILSFLQTMAQVRARLVSRYRSMMLAGLLSALSIAAVGISIAYWWRRDSVAVLASMVAGYLAIVVVLGIPRPSQLLAPSGLNLAERRAVFGVGVAGIVTAPMYWVLASLDRWFLGALKDTATVGIYSVGYNVAIVGTMFSTAVAAVWLPEAARVFEKDPVAARAVLGKLVEKIVVALAVVWLAVVAAGGDILRMLSAGPYHVAAPVIPFIAAGVFFNGVLQVASSISLLARRLQWTVPWWILGTIMCCTLNFLLIPRFGAIGAAVTQAISFGIVAGGIWMSAQSALQLEIRQMRMAACLACLIECAVVMYPAWASKPLLSLASKLPVGIANAVAAAFWIAPAECRGLFAARRRIFR